MESNELPDSEQLGVISCRAGVQSLDDGRHVSEDGRVH